MVLAEGEQIEMGGIMDAEKGALIYKKTTKVQVVPSDSGSQFQKKKVTSITSETGWLGKGSPGKVKSPKKTQPVKSPWKESWSDDKNPLYSEEDYGTDFFNPVYEQGEVTGPSSSSMGAELDERPSRHSDKGDEYVDYLAGDQQVDTLF